MRGAVNRPERRSLRLPGYDYTTAGLYFVTMVTQGRERLFGEVADGQVQPSPAGRLVTETWLGLPERFPTVALDHFVVMPNHLHGLLALTLPGSLASAGGSVGGPGPTVGEVIGAFKSLVTVAYARQVREAGWACFNGRLWQRNYYEHVVRDDEDLTRLRWYIEENPQRWEEDDENPANNR